MITPEQFQEIGETLLPLLDELTEWITQDMIERFMIRFGRGEEKLLTGTDEWQAWVLKQAGGNLDEIQKALAKSTGKSQQEIAKIFKDSGIQAAKADAEAAAVTFSGLSPGMMAIITDAYERTVGEITNITRTTAGATNQAFMQKQQSAAASTSKVSEQMGKFAKRIATIAKKVFIFTLIAKALRAMRSVLLNTINADKQMSASLAQIRGNLLTAFAPIYSFVLPAIRTLLSWLAKLTAVISSVFGAIFGQTASQAQANAKALYQQANATSAAGDAAEKAKRQLSGLDEMNRWESNDSSGGGSGGGGSAAPDFSGVSQVKLPDNVQAGLAKIGEALRSIIESLKRIWDSPVVQFIVTTVLYVAMQRIAWILSSVGLVLEGIADILDGNVWEGIKKVGLGLLDLMNPIGGLQDGFKSLWEKVASGALSAWEGIKNAFKSVPEWFQGKFRDAWQKVKDVFSTGGRIWSGIKEGIENTFRAVVNAIIRGMNTIIAVPFNRINSMLNTIRNAHFLGISPFQNMWGVNPLPVPQIPMLARGAVIPANRQFLAVLGDQRNGNNLEAPESLLRQIVREEAGGAGSRYEFIARLDRRTLFDEVITEAKLRKGQTGKNPLVAV